MKLCGSLVIINDDATVVFGKKVSNKCIGMIFGTLQLAVTASSFAQHVYSLVSYNHIFYCQFNHSLLQDSGQFLAYDIIIYDYGLFNFLLGTTECVANYLDGGYMRCLWCVIHILSLIIMVSAMVGGAKKPIFLWPILIMQSIYSLGLIILALATLPKLLHAFVSRVSPRFLGLIGIYLSGTAMNWFFTFSLWHYNWHLESLEKQNDQRRLRVNEDVEDNDIQETNV